MPTSGGHGAACTCDASQPRHLCDGRKRRPRQTPGRRGRISPRERVQGQPRQGTRGFLGKPLGFQQELCKQLLGQCVHFREMVYPSVLTMKATSAPGDTLSTSAACESHFSGRRCSGHIPAYQQARRWHAQPASAPPLRSRLILEMPVTNTWQWAVLRKECSSCGERERNL